MDENEALPPPAEASDPVRQRKVLAQVAEALARRRLTAPAIFTLEATKPLSYVASQTLVFFKPIVQGLLSLRDYETFALALENRDNVEWLIQQLEACEEREWQARHHRPDPGESSDAG
jgi:hypothetical protein